MELINFYLLLFLVFSNIILDSNANGPQNYVNLEMVQVIFRHGDRTPDRSDIARRDPNRHNYNRPGIRHPFGELTEVGVQRAHYLGQLLRQMYGQFLSDYYNPNEVYARSTFLKRTKMSTEYLLQGLYPNSNLNSYSIEQGRKLSDRLFLTSHYPSFRLKVRRLKRIKEQLLEPYKKDIKFIHKQSRMKEKKIMNLNYLIESLESSGNPIPNWCTENIKQVLKKIYEIEQDIKCYNDELKKMNSGPLIKEFLKNAKSNQKKIYLYGGHDFNLAHLVRTLGIKNYLDYPSYSSAIIFEKYGDSIGQQFFRVLTYDGEGVVRETNIKQCSTLCPISKFREIFAPVIPSESDLEINVAAENFDESEIS